MDDLLQHEMLIDIGEKTMRNYEDILSLAGTKYVNGPMGVFEKKQPPMVQRPLWEEIGSSDEFNDSVAAANMFGGLHLYRRCSGAFERELLIVVALKRRQKYDKLELSLDLGTL